MYNEKITSHLDAIKVGDRYYHVYDIELRRSADVTAPVENSYNVITSGAVYNAIAPLNSVISGKETAFPTESSNSLITSGAVYTAYLDLLNRIQDMQETIDNLSVSGLSSSNDYTATMTTYLTASAADNNYSAEYSVNQNAS